MKVVSSKVPVRNCSKHTLHLFYLVYDFPLSISSNFYLALHTLACLLCGLTELLGSMLFRQILPIPLTTIENHQDVDKSQIILFLIKLIPLLFIIIQTHSIIELIKIIPSEILRSIPHSVTKIPFLLTTTILLSFFFL